MGVKRVSILHKGHILIIEIDSPFWKYCGSCGEIIQDNDIDKFIKKMEEHNCRKEGDEK